MTETEYANTIVDRLGGTTAAAAFFEIKLPSVSNWRTNGIPKYRLQYLRLARPDVFEGLEEPANEELAKEPTT